ncbi:hypothetical protein [Flavobacterium sp. TBRC 19031]|uniref:hypothetical protein n=1 Tax=Flavobacterium mekongense TaxID=3379707 RepID=UPI00399AC4E7
MINKNYRESYVPSETEQVDWVAFEFLQNKRENLLEKSLKSNTYFKIDAIEYALDRVLENPNRLATGEQLAKDLFRDGKRVISSRLGLQGNGKVRREAYEYNQEKDVSQVEFENYNFENAVILIKSSFIALPKNEALALYLHTVGLTTAENIKQFLNVTVRHYRNLLNQAKRKLQDCPGFKEAFLLIHLHSDDADIREFFTSLINKMFNYQLS